MAHISEHVLAMGIISKHRDNLFVSLMVLLSVLTVCLGIYEFRRDHSFRCDILHARLQLNNLTVSDPEIRVTIIDTLGNVLSDSWTEDVNEMGNHLYRKEVQDAIHHGSGYVIMRTSETSGEKYFYSATYFPDKGLVVRSSVPYSAPLTDSLKPDYTFFFYTGGILLLISVVMILRFRLRESEREKLRIKRQLTENAAHELKTPAATIEGYLETIVSSPDMPDDVRDSFIQRCYVQSKRMSQLLADMNTLTKMDNSSIVRPETIIDLCAIVRQISDETRQHFSEKDIDLILNLPEKLEMQADPSLMYSLCRNIYDNALAYANGATSFTVQMEAKGHVVSMRFSDNGPGVPKESLSHLFERFYRVDKGRSRRLGGTGLGLSIVKNIAVQYGGTAIASTTPGGGLTIEIKMRTLNA